MDPAASAYYVASVVTWPIVKLGGLAVGIAQGVIVGAAMPSISVSNVVAAGTAVSAGAAVVTGAGLMGLPTLAAGAGATAYYLLRRND